MAQWQHKVKVPIAAGLPSSRASKALLARGGAILVPLLLGVVAGSCLRPSRAAELECRVQYADVVWTHRVAPTSDPYTVPSLAIHGRFEFRAVYVTEPSDLAALNVYVYQTNTPTRALVHQLKLRPPFNPTREGKFGITGLNLVYDERARELQYWCGFGPMGTP